MSNFAQVFAVKILIRFRFFVSNLEQMLNFGVNLRKKGQIKIYFLENIISGINPSDFLKIPTEFTTLPLIFLDFWVYFIK